MKNLSPPGARGSGFIVPSSEREPLDQTDIDWTVILDPLAWCYIVREKSPDPTPGGAGAQVNWAGAQVNWAGAQCLAPLPSCGFWSLLDGRKLHGALISLCYPGMWPFLPYFLITPYRSR